MTDLMTDLRKRWAAAKRRHPQHLILLRSGDFYEAMDADASVVAKVLDRRVTNGLCGIPAWEMDRAVFALVAAGYRVATEDSSKITPERG